MERKWVTRIYLLLMVLAFVGTILAASAGLWLLAALLYASIFFFAWRIAKIKETP